MTSFIILVVILGTLIFIHELGHFLAAKKSGVHIYEFALGFGPKIWSKTGKDKVIYSLRLFPLGGFVQMAGEVYEDDNKIPKSKLMCNKPWLDRMIIICAGVFNNFVMAIILLFVFALAWGYQEPKTIVGKMLDGYPAQEAGIVAGDKILTVNGKKTNTWDMFILRVNLKEKSKEYSLLVEKEDGREITYRITPEIEKNKNNQEVKVFGFVPSQKKYTGFANAIKYSINEFKSVVSTMFVTIGGLFKGTLSVKNLAGPVGIYTIVDETSKYGLSNIIYLMALLSINLGFINILPFPAFDGGRAFFLIVEKIIGKPVNQKFENTLHTIFFLLLLALMIYVTIQDVIRLF